MTVLASRQRAASGKIACVGFVAAALFAQAAAAAPARLQRFMTETGMTKTGMTKTGMTKTGAELISFWGQPYPYGYRYVKRLPLCWHHHRARVCDRHLTERY